MEEAGGVQARLATASAGMRIVHAGPADLYEMCMHILRLLMTWKGERQVGCTADVDLPSGKRGNVAVPAAGL